MSVISFFMRNMATGLPFSPRVLTTLKARGSRYASSPISASLSRVEGIGSGKKRDNYPTEPEVGCPRWLAKS